MNLMIGKLHKLGVIKSKDISVVVEAVACSINEKDTCIVIVMNVSGYLSLSLTVV